MICNGCPLRESCLGKVNEKQFTGLRKINTLGLKQANKVMHL
jgi:hypothetical protein